MKIIKSLTTTTLLLASALSFALDFKEDFNGLTIKPISEYPNVGETITIDGVKNIYAKPSSIPLSNKAIFNFLKVGVDKKNLNKDYLKKDFTWGIYPILDMQPGWETAISPAYLPKYYSFPPLDLNRDALASYLSEELEKSPWPQDKLKDNFKNIFSEATPVYINDLMFFVDKDSIGYYSSNLLGLTRFSLPTTTSPTNSAIHLSKAKISVKTLIHEYLHDKIRYSATPDNYPKVRFQSNPLLGLDKTWVDTVKQAFKIRDAVDTAFLMEYPKSKGTWWSPLANTPTATSNYSFTTKEGVSMADLTKSELWDVMTFMEEFIVRVVVESLFKEQGTAIVDVMKEIPGLDKAFVDTPKSIPVLQEFAENYYLKGDFVLKPDMKHLVASVVAPEKPEAFEFTPEERAMIDNIVLEALDSIRRLGEQFDKDMESLSENK